MKITVPYGEGVQTAILDDRIPAEIVDPPKKEVPADAESLIQDALNHPVGTPPLEEMVRPGEKISVIVNDQTRPGPHAQMSRAIIRRLLSSGVREEDVTFVIATGTHAGPSESQLDQILGGLQHRFAVHVHDCRAPHVYMGNTPTADVPIWYDPVIASSDFIITTGMIAPHHSAGFSGGRKSLVPGVVSLETLKTHHSLPIRPYEPAINRLEGNLFHLVALEGARMVPVRFILNVVQDMHKQTIAAVAGDLEAAHMRGVEYCREANTVELRGRADLVITSPGGHPRDIDLWQSQKALSVAELVCQPKDNTFILVARAGQGIPRLFIDWMEAARDPQDVVDRFRREGFDIGSNKAFMYARCMLKGRIILVSEALTPEQTRRVMMDWAPDLQTAVNMACEKRPPKKVTVLPRAVNIIPHIIGE